jgi:hypothetical protein
MLKLDALHYTFDSGTGMFVFSMVISNDSKKAQKIGWSKTSLREARWNAIRNTVKEFGIELGPYQGSEEANVVDSTKQLLCEIANLKPG